MREKGVKGKPDLHAVESVGNNVVVAAGEDATIRVSTNRGGNWGSPITIGDGRDDFLDVALTAANGGFGIAVGDDGLIAVSTPPYTRWSHRGRDITERFNAVVIDKSGKTAIAAGEAGTIIVSSSKGDRWEYVDRTSRISRNELMALSIDGKVAVFVGENSTVLRGEMPDGQGARYMEMQVISNRFQIGERKNALREQKKRLEERLEQLAEYGQKTTAELEKMGSELAEYVFFQTNALRVGILVVLMFLSQHLMVLARYNFRLSELYYTRSKVLMATAEAVSWSSLTAEEFDQVMRTFSTEDLEFGRTPRSVVEMAMEFAKSIVQRKS